MVSSDQKTTLPVLRALTVAIVAGLALLGFTVPASAATSYAALGDSYSSGLGAGSYGDSGSCKRSANAYPKLWASANGASLNFLACSGARTPDVLSQLDKVTSGTNVVTVSVGGNDAGFVDVMTDCTLGSDQACVDRVAEAKAYVNGTLPGLLNGVYTKIKQKAPNAKVYVLGYPRFYKVPGSCNVGLSDTKRAAINSGADTLASVTSARASSAGFTFVDVRGVFTGHEICAADRWLHSLTWPVEESYHPTANGQKLGYLAALNSAAG
ncbi:SGNH/GDSL hydrolase family protein [Amycolatopsis sp. 195334CR]|uniref:SGNH/GDSL hydrolase family protein n=1 Tax=Amycolatopsis sp. 195334CR TaxID=2814588 RepID=UPI001A8EA3F5|nr:SGNH/GDSL hydrolase family protein [Amycolatopsis sp. 195334CR]MBN6034447.1 SGNH/GDSL hydrolase family protein [Amycolatopsis sp. 195334CR]